MYLRGFLHHFVSVQIGVYQKNEYPYFSNRKNAKKGCYCDFVIVYFFSWPIQMMFYQKSNVSKWRVVSKPGQSGLTRRRMPIAQCEGLKTGDGPCLASSTGRMNNQIFFVLYLNSSEKNVFLFYPRMVCWSKNMPRQYGIDKYRWVY